MKLEVPRIIRVPAADAGTHSRNETGFEPPPGGHRQRQRRPPSLPTRRRRDLRPNDNRQKTIVLLQQ